MNNLNNYYQRKYGRRAVLRGLGGSALVPFIPLLSADAQAQTSPIKRFIVVYSPNGIEDTLPTGSETSFEFREPLRPFNKYKNEVSCLGGLDWKAFEDARTKPSNNHPEPCPITLTAAFSVKPSSGGKNDWTSNRPSIDQFIAQRLRDNAQTRTKFKSIIAGVKTQSWASKIIYAEPNKPISPENRPSNLHARIFDGFDPSSAGGGNNGPDPAVLRALSERRSVIDSVRADLNKVNSRIGADDKAKIDSHLQAIREIELRIDFEAEQAEAAADSNSAETNNACSIPRLKDEDGSFENNYRKEGENQMDIIANALACDLTRVATLMWSNGVSDFKFPSKGVNKEHHEITHEDTSGNKGNRIKVSQWYAERVLYLVEKLKSIPDGNGTLFDSTAILWTSEHSGGGGHGRRNLPFTLFGNMGGSLRTGRFFKYGGRHHGDLYLTMAHAMGFTDVRFFGEDLGRGVLSNLLT